MDTVKWALELRDKVSPAGKAIASSFAKIGANAQRLGTKGLAVATKGIQALGSRASEMLPKIAKWVAIAGVAAAVGLAAAGVKLTADAMAFKDSTLIATKALLKSNALAGGAFKRMLDFAHYFGEDPAEAMGRFNKALADGFSARDAEKLLQAFGDLRLVTPHINVDALGSAFGELRKKARVELGDFQSAISAGGLNATLAFEALGKRLGKSAKEAEALLAGGRVDASTGLVALLDTINNRTNSKKVGERLEEYANTASGLVARLKNLPQQFMLRMTADDSPIKGTLKKLLEQLDPDGPNGKKIIGALNAAFTGISKVLADWATPEGIERLTKTLGGVIESAPKIIKAIGAISSGVLVVTDSITGFIDNCRFLWAEIKRGGGVATAFGAVLGLCIAPIVGIGIAVYGVGKAIVNGVTWIGKTIGDLGAKTIKWGGDVIDGLWKGMQEKWGNLKGGWNNLFKSLPASVRTTLEIKSPSRVFARLGAHTIEGFGVGAAMAAPRMQSDIADAIDGGRHTAAKNVTTTLARTVSTSRSSKSVVVHVGGISVETNAKDGRGMGREIVREIERHFDHAVLQ